MNRTPRTLVAGVAALCVAVATFLGSSAVASAQDKSTVEPQDPNVVAMVDTATAANIFSEETATFPLELPSDITWPALPSSFLQDDIRMQANVPRAIASKFWLCAWEGAYLSSQAEGKDDQQALKMIVAYESLPFYKEQVSDPDRGWFSSVVKPALEGDPNGIKADYEGCN